MSTLPPPLSPSQSGAQAVSTGPSATMFRLRSQHRACGQVSQCSSSCQRLVHRRCKVKCTITRTKANDKPEAFAAGVSYHPKLISRELQLRTTKASARGTHQTRCPAGDSVSNTSRGISRLAPPPKPPEYQGALYMPGVGMARMLRERFGVPPWGHRSHKRQRSYRFRLDYLTCNNRAASSNSQ